MVNELVSKLIIAYENEDFATINLLLVARDAETVAKCMIKLNYNCFKGKITITTNDELCKILCKKLSKEELNKCVNYLFKHHYNLIAKLSYIDNRIIYNNYIYGCDNTLITLRLSNKLNLNDIAKTFEFIKCKDTMLVNAIILRYLLEFIEDDIAYIEHSKLRNTITNIHANGNDFITIDAHLFKFLLDRALDIHNKRDIICADLHYLVMKIKTKEDLSCITDDLLENISACDIINIKHKFESIDLYRELFKLWHNNRSEGEILP